MLTLYDFRVPHLLAEGCLRCGFFLAPFLARLLELA